MANNPFRKFTPFRIILMTCLLLMIGVSVWINKSGLIESEGESLASSHGQEPGELYSPPMEKEDEATKLLQQASENYFYHEFAKGADNYRKAIVLFEARKNFKRVAKTYESLGDLYKFANEPEEAETSYKEAVKFHTQNQDSLGEGRALKDIGDLYMSLDQRAPAKEWYQKAQTAIAKAPVHRDRAKVYEAIGQFYWKTEELPLALENFTHAQETFAELRDQMGYDHITNVIAVIKRKKSPSSHSQRDYAPRQPPPAHPPKVPQHEL